MSIFVRQPIVINTHVPLTEISITNLNNACIVQDDLLLRVIFGKFVCEKQLVDTMLSFSSQAVVIWACPHSY